MTTNLRFADDIDGLAGEEEELAKLIECLNKASTANGMEISAEKTKLMTNNTSGINTEIKVNGQKLETVTSFKYLGSVITDEGSKPEILSRIVQTTAARLKPVSNNMSISLSSKIRLMHFLVTYIFLYACEREERERAGEIPGKVTNMRFIHKSNKFYGCQKSEACIP